MILSSVRLPVTVVTVICWSRIRWLDVLPWSRVSDSEFSSGFLTCPDIRAGDICPDVRILISYPISGHCLCDPISESGPDIGYFQILGPQISGRVCPDIGNFPISGYISDISPADIGYTPIIIGRYREIPDIGSPNEARYRV
jgi:hypothetical protein